MVKNAAMPIGQRAGDSGGRGEWYGGGGGGGVKGGQDNFQLDQDLIHTRLLFLSRKCQWHGSFYIFFSRHCRLSICTESETSTAR